MKDWIDGKTEQVICENCADDHKEEFEIVENGLSATMSKLEQYAMAAMQGLIMGGRWQGTGYLSSTEDKRLAERAFDLAEAMIAEGERRNK